MKLINAIQQVQIIGKKHGFILILVGGGAIRLIGDQTHIQSLDRQKRVIKLKTANDPTTQRSDMTLVDLDMIAFAEKPSAQTPQVFKKLQKELKVLQQKKEFPPISLEPVFYHPAWKKPNTLIQFVSSIEKEKETYFFRLDSIKQPVQTTSLAVWTWQVEDAANESIQTFSPLALQLRYAIRGLGKKPKDIQKVWKENAPFTKFVKEFDNLTKQKYQKDFREWLLFENKLQANTYPRIYMKRGLYQLYWRTVGTYLAHGTGIIGKILLPFGNTFFAGK